MWGAVLLGGASFIAGVFICLYYKLPIPPLFLTEFGILIGGCLGAGAVLTGCEKRAFPAAVSILVGTPACLLAGLSWLTTAVTLLLLGTVTWTLAEKPSAEGQSWRTL